MASSAQPLRLVLDTNVVVAGLLWNGPPRRLIELAIHPGEGQAVEFFSSAVLLDELAHTLAYPKFASRIEGFGTSVSALVAHYAALVDLVVPASVPRVVAGDADDDHVIAAAVAARAEWVVTGDRKHLLPIGSHRGIAIIEAAEALRRLTA
jgi:uncharacterized protein